MSILPQTLLAFVGSHLMSFSFLSAWHNKETLLYVGLDFANKSFSRLESRDRMLGNNDGGILGNVAGSLLGPLLHDETSKTPQIHIFVVAK